MGFTWGPSGGHLSFLVLISASGRTRVEVGVRVTQRINHVCRRLACDVTGRDAFDFQREIMRLIEEK